MAQAKKFRSEGLQHLYDRYIAKDPDRVASYERELENAEVARRVYDLRAEAGLTQARLAKRVGTTASVISRLEDADYEGHSLSMLRRIAAAVGKKVVIRFVPAGEKAGVAKRPAKPKKKPARAARGAKAARKSKRP